MATSPANSRATQPLVSPIVPFQPFVKPQLSFQADYFLFARQNEAAGAADAAAWVMSAS
jgi:hypothetical protein